jgi:hypothetical protein
MEKDELKIKDDDMQHLLMQSIVEKFEGVELLLHAALDHRPQIDHSAITNAITSLKKEILEALLLDRNVVNELNQNMAKLQQQISAIKDNKIEYRHVLHKGVWLSVGLAFTVLLFAGGWMHTYDKLSWYSENSIKYRYLRAFGNEGVAKLTHRIDSLYEIDNDNFRNNVVSEEKRIQVITDSVRLIAQKTEKNKSKSRN